ncbi:MAG TPA: PAS domain-containing protein [Aeromonadales bacterium]|nr:PAS domain-containing protein [Aeromonadales bacterium]
MFSNENDNPQPMTENNQVNTMNSEQHDLATLALERIRLPVMMVDTDLIVTYVNQASKDLFKSNLSVFQQAFPDINFSNLVGVCIDKFHQHPERQRKILGNPANLPFSTDIQVGDLKFNLQVSAAIDAKGIHQGSVLEWEEVTSRRENEIENSRLNSIVENMTTNVMLADLDFKITYMNPALKKMLEGNAEKIRTVFSNFDVDKLIGVCIDDFHKDPAHQRKVLSDRSNMPFTSNIRVADLHFKLTAFPLVDENDAEIGYAVEWVDSTLMQKRELEIKSFEAQTEAISKAQAVIEFNVDGTIITANENFLQTTGYTLAEIQGKHHRIFVKEEYAESPEYQHFWEKLNRGEYDSGEYLRVTKSGKDIWLQASYNPVLDETGKPFKIVKFGTDITNRVNNFHLVNEQLKTMAEGNFNEVLELPVAENFADLEESINNTTQKIKEVISEIAVAADQVSSSSRELSEGNADLSQRTEEQASSLEQTASAMEEFASAVKLTSDNAEQANTLAAESRDEAERGNTVLNKTNEAMENIDKSSRKIADIIGVIDDISFQTNLLALNAAVEAARAGEHGRGFAVVASEVRNLAQRSANAAKEIKELINDSLDTVEDGTRLSQESSKVLQGIINKIRDVAGIVRDISSATSEQATGVDEVNVAIAQMDKMTQQNAALVEQTAAAAESMEEQANALTTQISQFNVGDVNQESMAASSTRSVPKAQPVPSSSKIKSPVLGNTDDEDDWEEF